MLKVPQKMPKLIGFNPSDCDLSHVRPMVAEACAIISPAITSIGGFHKEVLDNLPDFVESMIAGDDPDDVIERFNDEVPARDVKGKTIDWSKIAGVVLPILSKFITDLLTPKAGAAAKSRGKSRGKK